MQLIVAITLTAGYVGLSLMFGGIRPEAGVPWWFFVPSAVAFFASGLAVLIMGRLPTPWINGPCYGPPSRHVHLSWRGAVWLPVWTPILLVLWHVLAILRMHFSLGRVFFLVAALALAVPALAALRSRREIRLLRNGEAAMARVYRSQSMGEWTNRIAYHFRTAEGAAVSGRAWDAGYHTPENASVPVFYDADNPQDHAVACGSWFEAEKSIRADGE
ncbi:MAG: DUF3592 domain-containing protein [Thermodesulfobacteriota bacterium]